MRKARPYSDRALARAQEDFADGFHDPLDETMIWRLLATVDALKAKLADCEERLDGYRKAPHDQTDKLLAPRR